jgi:hypothetical protein
MALPTKFSTVFEDEDPTYQLDGTGALGAASNVATSGMSDADARALIEARYATIGRTGVGTGANQIDKEGLDAWTRDLVSGVFKPEDLNTRFSTAVTDYMAQNPTDQYTNYVKDYLADKTGTVTAGALTKAADTATTANNTATTGALATVANNIANTTDTANTDTTDTSGALTQAETGTKTVNNNNVVALGDSTTFGTLAGNQLNSNMVTSAQNALGGNYNITNLGVNSTTVGDLLNGLNNTGNNWANTLASDAGIVVLNYGLNEAFRGEDPETFRANLINAVTQAKASGKQVILQTPNVVGSSNAWGDVVGSYANIIRDVAKATGSSLDDKFAATSVMGNIFDTTTVDDLHPSESTYNALGVNLANTISGLNAKKATTADTAADTSTAGALTQAATGSTTGNTAADTGSSTAFDPSTALNLNNGTYLTAGGDIVDTEGNKVKSTGSANTVKLATQILGQKTTKQWSGQGFGSAEANAADMASILSGIGITDIKDFGKVPVYATAEDTGQKRYNGQFLNSQYNPDGTVTYGTYKSTGQTDGEGNEVQTFVPVPKDAKLETVYGISDGGEGYNYVDASKIKTVDGKVVADTGQTTYGNVKTGQAVPVTYGERQTDNAFGGTFVGSGNTGYRVDMSTGTPRFYTTGASSSDIGQLQPFLTLASFIPGVAPFAMAANAAISASQGNWAGAILSGLGAAGGFAGAVTSEIDALANAGRSAEAVALWESSVLAQNAGNIKTATDVARLLNAADKGNITGVINAGLTLGGVSVPPEVRTAANLFNAATAIGSGDTAGMLDAAGSLLNSSDAKLAASALRFKNAVDSGDQTAIINATQNFTSTVKSASNSNSAFNSLTNKLAAGDSVENAIASLSSDADVNLPSGLQLAGVSNGTVSDAGNGLTLGGVDAKTQATLDAMKDIDKIGTTVSGAPSWVTVAKGEEVTGNRVDNQGQERYTITRANPNNPDEPVVYEVVKDSETGNVSYEWGGVSQDEEGNVLGGGSTVSSGSKPSWTWEVKDDAVAGSEDSKSIDTTSDIGNVDTVDGKKGAKGTLTALSKDAGVIGADGVIGAEGDGVKGTEGDGTKGDGVKGTGDKDGTGDKGGTGGDGTGDGDGDGDGTGGDGTGGDGVDTTVITNDDGTTTTLVVTDDGKVTTHDCAEGYHWDESAKACVPDTVKQPPQPPVVNTPVVKTPTQTTNYTPSLMAGMINAGDLGRLPPQMLKAYMTKDKFVDPLARLHALQEGMNTEKMESLPKVNTQESDMPDQGTWKYGNAPDDLDTLFGDKTEEAPAFKAGGYVAPLQMASGGAMPLPLLVKSGGALGALPRPDGRMDFRHGAHVAGDGDGQSDDIKAMLADGEFVFPADVVSALGNGSTKAGSDKLYEMMHSIRERARSKKPKDLPPPALKSPLDYLKKVRST